MDLKIVGNVVDQSQPNLPINTSGLHPLGQAILTRTIDDKGISSKTIALPPSVTGRMVALSTEAVVLEVGPGPYKDEPCRVKVGDRVVLAAWAGSVRTGNDGLEYRVVNNRDIYCKIDKVEPQDE